MYVTSTVLRNGNFANGVQKEGERMSSAQGQKKSGDGGLNAFHYMSFAFALVLAYLAGSRCGGQQIDLNQVRLEQVRVAAVPTATVTRAGLLWKTPAQIKINGLGEPWDSPLFIWMDPIPPATAVASPTIETLVILKGLNNKLVDVTAEDLVKAQNALSLKISCVRDAAPKKIKAVAVVSAARTVIVPQEVAARREVWGQCKKDEKKAGKITAGQATICCAEKVRELVTRKAGTTREKSTYMDTIRNECMAFLDEEKD